MSNKAEITLTKLILMTIEANQNEIEHLEVLFKNGNKISFWTPAKPL